MIKTPVYSLTKNALLALLLLFAINVFKFQGLNNSPPGFYGDETAGATQVICLLEDSHDFFGNKLPLFAEGFPGAGQYTPVYLYGQALWIYAFGSSIASFRSFLALVTSLTILFLYLWVKNKSDAKTAFLVALSASIMPWSFQFSRIAWDPPLAPLFLIMCLWSTSLKSRANWFAFIFLALAAYSYPPMRVTAPLFVLLLPGVRWKYKMLTIIGAAILCIPLFLKMQDPEFLARSRALAIWTYFNFNPYENFGIFSLPILFFKQLSSYLTPDFLFFAGDTNLRHSTQKFGMLSWLDLIAFICLIWLLLQRFRNKINFVFSDNQLQLLQIALIGILLGLAPAALTHTSFIPNALRAIGAWPFFSLLSGLILARFGEITNKPIQWISSLLAIIFFIFYLNHYFFTYPSISKGDFLSGDTPIELAFSKMSKSGERCASLRVTKTTPEINQEIFFSYGHKSSGIEYLRNHWLEIESWGVWTNDKGSDVLIPLPAGNPRKIVFNARALVTGAHPEASVNIWMNGKLIRNVTLTKFEGNEIELEIPSSLKHPDKLWIEFRNLNPTTPVAAGFPGDDTRITGLGLVSATFK